MKFLISKDDKYRSGIYIITNTVNRRIYIGSAVNLRHRFISHRNTLARGCHKSPQLQSFVNKHGIGVLLFDVLWFCDKEELLTQEQVYLDLHKPFGKAGFNTLTMAGSATGLTHSEETKRKVSAAHKGRKHTEQAKANMKIGQQNRNWKLSEQGRQRKIEAHKGKIVSAQTRELLGLANRGRVHSEETRNKNRLAHTGKILTDEHKAKLSQEMLQRNPFGKLVINLETGIFYDSGIQAAQAHNLHAIGLNRKLRGERKNNTPFRLV